MESERQIPRSSALSPRIAIGGILHETHTFMQQPTTLADFAAQALHYGDEVLSAMAGSRSGIGGMIDRAAEMKKEAEVVCIAVMAGFAYADTADTGASVIVTTDAQPELARRYAQELCDILRRQRDSALPQLLSPAAAVARAAQHPGAPVILVDSADNIGGGTPGDGADALAAMLEYGVSEGAIVLADPEASARCWRAGKGARLTLELGGKVDRWHGKPVRVTGTVQALSDGIFTCELADNHFASLYGRTVNMGRSAWLRAAGVNILLTERKTPPMDLAQLRHIGIIPEAQKMIVVKSAVAYRAAYLPIASAVIEMDTAGLCSGNLARFVYQNLKRPIFPPRPSGLRFAGFKPNSRLGLASVAFAGCLAAPGQSHQNYNRQNLQN